MAKRKVAGFCVNQHVIYPTHGVGKITAIEKQTVGGYADGVVYYPI